MLLVSALSGHDKNIYCSSINIYDAIKHRLPWLRVRPTQCRKTTINFTSNIILNDFKNCYFSDTLFSQTLGYLNVATRGIFIQLENNQFKYIFSYLSWITLLTGVRCNVITPCKNLFWNGQKLYLKFKLKNQVRVLIIYRDTGLWYVL